MIQPLMNAAAPHLVNHVVPAMKKHGGPFGLAGKIIGLSQAEVEVGIPWWGWTAIGIGVGATTAYLLREKIEKIVQ
jgi:hypothetical protein